MSINSFRFDGLDTIEKDGGGPLITVVRFVIVSSTNIDDSFNAAKIKVVIPFDPDMTLAQIQEAAFRELPGTLEGIAAELKEITYQLAREKFTEFSPLPSVPFAFDVPPLSPASDE